MLLLMMLSLVAFKGNLQTQKHYAVLHQLDQKIIYPHYDFKHLTEKYFEIGMKLNDFSIQLVKYCTRKTIESWCVAAGIIESSVCLRQGHDSLTSMRHYQGLAFSEDEMRDIKKQLTSWNLIK